MEINSISRLKGAGAADPFEQFNVEFGSALSGPQALSGASVQGPSFLDVLNNAIHEVQKSKNDAEQITFDFATGKPIDIHTMMIAVAKADVAMQLTSAVVSKTATSVNQLLQTQI